MNINKYFKKQKGAIILMFLVFLPFILAFVGLAVDFGYVYAEKSKLQNAADAAALAGVPHLQEDNLADYTKAMLTANSFTPVGDSPKGELSAAQNWIMSFEKEPQDGQAAIETPDPKEASRLRVRIQKSITLTFLPIVAPDLRNMDLVATAVARGSGSATPKPTDEFQFIAMDTLRLGALRDDNSVSVFIPSFSKDSTAPDLYAYKDFGDYLTKNIYASKIDFKTKSVLRSSAKVLTTDRLTEPLKTNLLMFDENDYTRLSDSKYTLAQINKMVNDKTNEGQKLFTDGKGNVITALVINVNEDVLEWDDAMFESYKNNSNCFSGNTLIAPVIFYSPPEKDFLINFRVNSFTLKAPLIIYGGNISIFGSTKYSKFSDIYSFTTTKNGKTTGGVITIEDNASEKDFTGTIYSERYMTIKSPKNYKRHIFRDTLISKGDIEFAGDGTRESSHRFESKPIATKISLVE